MPRDDARTPQPQRPTFGEMLEEVLDLGAGLAIVLLPLFPLAVAAIVRFVVLPAIVLLVPVAALAAIGAALAAPPYLLARWLRRRRRRTAPPSADSALRSIRTRGQSRVGECSPG